MVGQTPKITSEELANFIATFLKFAQSLVSKEAQSTGFLVGESLCKLESRLDGIYQEYIINSFISTVSDRQHSFTLLIWESDEFWFSDECASLRRQLRTQMSLMENGTLRYRIAHHPYEEMLYLFDRSRGYIHILVGPISSRNLACFVTPFRIAIDWISQESGGMALHASVIAKEGSAFLLNGPSGSGKSTMAALSLLNGYQMIVDDVAVVFSSRIFAVYRHAKLARELGSRILRSSDYFELPVHSQGKVIFDLSEQPGFVPTANLFGLIFPSVTGVVDSSRISRGAALKLLGPNSMREVLGGTESSLGIMAKLVQALPAYQLSLDEQESQGFKELMKIVSFELSDLG